MNLQKIERTTNQKKLAKWAMTKRYLKSYRTEAVRRITEQDRLAFIAGFADDYSVRLEAAKGLNDMELAQKTFTFVAKHGNAGDQLEAAEYLSDKSFAQEVLFKLIKNSCYNWEKAIDLLTNQNLLLELARLDDEKIAGAAARKIKDQNQLFDIIESSPYKYDKRNAALENLTDQNLLMELVKKHSDSVFGESALKKIEDSSLLITIIKNKEYAVIFRLKALLNMTGKRDAVNRILPEMINELNGLENEEKAEAYTLLYETATTNPALLKANWNLVTSWIAEPVHIDNHTDGGCAMHYDSGTNKKVSYKLPPYK